MTDAAPGWKGPNDPMTRVGGIEPETVVLVEAMTIGGSGSSNTSSPTDRVSVRAPAIVSFCIPVMPFATRSWAFA